jgi:hypothetical protein
MILDPAMEMTTEDTEYAKAPEQESVGVELGARP